MYSYLDDQSYVDKSIKVLIIDDIEQVTRIYKKILDQYFDVHIANTVHESFDKLVSEIFDVIILDYSFNRKIDGIEYSNIIRNTQPTAFILMYTEERNYDLVIRAINQGSIDQFHNKPFNAKELIQIIKSVKTQSVSEAKERINLVNKQNKAKNAIGIVLKEPQEVPYVRVDGVIFSNNSLPIFYKILNQDLFTNFSGTLFTGMISALTSFGDELFDTASGLRRLTYGNVVLVFEKIPEFEICFILSNTEHVNNEKIRSSLNSSIDQIKGQIMKDPQFIENLNGKNHAFIESVVDQFQILLNS
ncbi:MAG: response regulator [Candidatus Kariarchaeaceae archaeon]|jgi:DNA-binding NarL/FixJ family response regulator